jgi:arginyl-tRNA synthetase
VLYKKEDGSVWIDLTAEGLDEKLLLRRDGTSVYMTQDLGLAQQKFEDHPYDQSIYVIGDEQNYHMKVLKLILAETTGCRMHRWHLPLKLRHGRTAQAAE